MRLSYVRILVDDFQTCFRFYRDAIGLKVLWGDENSVYAEYMVSADTRLAIFKRELSDRAIGIESIPGVHGQHRFSLVFEVEDVDQYARELASRSARLVAEPQDRSAWGARTAHFSDPDGNLIEINSPIQTSDG